MRMFAVVIVVTLLLPIITYADATSSGQTVTYSSNPELSCLAHSVLGGAKCYCNSGYKVSGAECVADTPAGPAQNEIYDDIKVAVPFNPDLTCAQLGYTAAIDLDMCQKFKANPSGQWKIIQRPSSSAPLVTNPWAQPGQQVLNSNSSSTQSIPAIVATPPPVPSTPKPTTTPEIVKPPAEEKPAAKAESKPIEEKPTPEPSAPKPVATTTTYIDQATSSTPEALVAKALAEKNLVAMSSALAQLAAASEAAAPPPLPEPPAPTPIPHEDIKLKDQEAPEKPKSFFTKIADWFSWIF